jgi:hypothetical protein
MPHGALKPLKSERRRAERRARISEIRVVQRIERLQADFGGLAFCDGKLLRQTQVERNQ